MKIPRFLAVLVSATTLSAAGCHTKGPAGHPEVDISRSDSVLTSGRRLLRLVGAVDRYGREHGGLPAALEPVLRSVGGGELVASDAWGREVRFTPRGQGFELRSAGSDGVAGNADDIVAIGRLGRSIACELRDEERVLTYTSLAPPCEGSPAVVLPLCPQPAWEYRGVQGAPATRRDSVDATGRALVRLARVVDGYGRDVGGAPPSLLPLFGRTKPADAWGRSVRYVARELSFELRSAGADGAFDNGDDVVVSARLGRTVPCAFRSEHGTIACDDPPLSCGEAPVEDAGAGY